jgi:adenosylmethionine-8-amino-7-oxononanoate aminotransferase
LFVDLDGRFLRCAGRLYAHPVGCAAAVDSLEVLEREDLQVFEQRFAALIDRVPAVVPVSGAVRAPL